MESVQRVTQGVHGGCADNVQRATKRARRGLHSKCVERSSRGIQRAEQRVHRGLHKKFAENAWSTAQSTAWKECKDCVEPNEQNMQRAMQVYRKHMEG